jgi:hypothetical protein
MVVGVGRSGTTLLQTMLGGHHTICMLPETQFFHRYVGRIGFGNLIGRPYLKNVASLRLERDRRLQRSGVTPARLNQRGMTACAAYRLLVSEYCSMQNARDEFAYSGDKDARAIDYLSRLKGCCPNVKVLHIVRDPRDVMVSRRKAEWSSGRTLIREVVTCVAQYQASRTAEELFGMENYFEVKYEDLIADPEGTLRGICDFMDLPYDGKMVTSYRQVASRLVDDSEKAWKGNVSQPILKDNSGKWIGELRASEVRLIESFCSEVFERHSYSYAATTAAERGTARVRFVTWIGTALYQVVARFH